MVNTAQRLIRRRRYEQLLGRLGDIRQELNEMRGSVTSPREAQRIDGVLALVNKMKPRILTAMSHTDGDAR